MGCHVVESKSTCEERAKEDIRSGVEAMEQGNPERNAYNHGVIGLGPNDFGCRIQWAQLSLLYII